MKPWVNVFWKPMALFVLGLWLLILGGSAALKRGLTELQLLGAFMMLAGLVWAAVEENKFHAKIVDERQREYERTLRPHRK